MAHSRSAPSDRRLSSLPLQLSLAAILILTLVPMPSKPGQSHIDARFLPILRLSDLSNIVENVLLFVPLGAGCALRRWTLPGTTVFGCILSASVELLQLVIPGRFCGPRDVVTNTAGAVLGYLLAQTPAFRAMVDRVWPPRRASGRDLRAARHSARGGSGVNAR